MEEQLDEVRVGLNALDQRVASGRFGQAKLWGGAGVVIAESAQDPSPTTSFYAAPRTVVTPHARTLSWEFAALWALFGPLLDHVSKFEFFGRLASSAIRYQAHVEGRGTERDLLGAVLHEAFAILNDLSADAFSGPMITSDGAIHDDAVPDAERPHYVTVEEADAWLAEPDKG